VRPLSPIDAATESALRATLALRVVEARKRLGLSGRALARIMNRSGSWVREVESGAQWPPPYLIAALARALQCSPGWFYGDDDVADRVVAAVRELLEERTCPTT